MVVGFTSSLGLEGRSRALFWFLANPGNRVFFVFGYTGNHPQAVFFFFFLFLNFNWYFQMQKLILAPPPQTPKRRAQFFDF